MGFTLVESMWFADFEDDDAEKYAAESLAAKVGELRGVLPVPTVAAKLVSMVNDPDYKSSDVADLISTDAGLSSRILRVINSSSYSLRSECTSIAHAVVLLGPKTVRDTALALSLLGIFDDRDGHAESILTHSAQVAELACLLGQHCEKLAGVDLYACALLHDIGKLLLLQAEPDYAEVYQSSSEQDQDHLKEREAFGYDHAVLAGHVLSSWNIPEPIPTSIAWHHKPKRAFEAANETTAVVAAVRLADRLCYELANASCEQGAVLDALVQDEAAQYLDMRRSDFDAMWPELVAVFADEIEEDEAA